MCCGYSGGYEVIFNCNKTISFGFPPKRYKPPATPVVSLNGVSVKFAKKLKQKIFFHDYCVVMYACEVWLKFTHSGMKCLHIAYTAGAGNLFTITGHMNCGLSLAGCK